MVCVQWSLPRGIDVILAIEDLKLRFTQVEHTVRQLSEGANYVRSIVTNHE